MSGTVWIGLCILLGAIALEVFAPTKVREGFLAITGSGRSDDPPRQNFITNMITRRGDVGVGMEIGGYKQDPRYFHGYADVERYGVKNDFCRMVTLGTEEDMFFACALAGTTGPSTDYKTNTVKDGFRISRDDYMRDIVKDGRDAYCRILKDKDGSYQPLCRRAFDLQFYNKDELDTDPPETIKTMLDFYVGCEMWLRFRDDMVDYVDKAIIQTGGGLTIDSTPNPTVARGLTFNGIDQFVRLGDTINLSLGNRIKMRSIRAFSVWVRFDAFTNNAHIFDFGDGPGVNNIFMGILGKGEGGDDSAQIRPGDKCPETTIPTEPSGAQFCPEIRAQTLFEMSAANVEKWDCKNPSVLARKLGPIQTKPVKTASTGPATRATLIYEVWDQKLRKVQIKVNRAIPLDKWTHILVTAKTMDAMRPDLNVYINGNLAFTQENGYLPQAKVTSNNYFGKSNWANDMSGYELRDELFQGSIFDFRMYSNVVSETKGKRILQWGLEKLGLDNSFATVS